MIEPNLRRRQPVPTWTVCHHGQPPYESAHRARRPAHASRPALTQIFTCKSFSNLFYMDGPTFPPDICCSGYPISKRYSRSGYESKKSSDKRVHIIIKFSFPKDGTFIAKKSSFYLKYKTLYLWLAST